MMPEISLVGVLIVAAISFVVPGSWQTNQALPRRSTMW
jgi:hypothetical protein